jgi:hypothetical protein
MLRVLSNSNKVRESIEGYWSESLTAIHERASLFDERSKSNLDEVAIELLAKANAEININAQWNSSEKSNQFIFDPSDVLEKDQDLTTWKVLNSMRSVDSDAGVQFSAEVFGRGIKKRNSVAEIELGEL